MNNSSSNLPVFIHTGGLFFAKFFPKHCLDLLQPIPPSYFYKIWFGATGSHPVSNPSNHQHKNYAKNTDVFSCGAVFDAGEAGP